MNFARIAALCAVLFLAQVAQAAELAPSCLPLADPSASTQSCVVAATFPAADTSVCFDSTGLPSICMLSTEKLEVAADGTFEFNGQTYAGAPAGASHVAAATFGSIGFGKTVLIRGLRFTATATAIDAFLTPAAPPVEAPTPFSPIAQ